MKNLAKEKLEKHRKILGTFFELGTPTAMECLGIAGMDFVIIDTEHGPFDVESSMDFIRAAQLHHVTPFVRVKDISRSSILKMLDVGAQGIIIPCVETVEQIHEIVKAGKYYPLGERGVAPTRGSEFWYADYASQGLEHYFEVSNQESLLIPQCETRGCLEHIEEIAATEGIDGIFIGPYDLSVALEKPGQFRDPVVFSAIRRIVQACRDAKKFVLIYAGDIETSKEYLKKGFDGVAYNLDAVVYTQSYCYIKNALKEDLQ